MPWCLRLFQMATHCFNMWLIMDIFIQFAPGGLVHSHDAHMKVTYGCIEHEEWGQSLFFHLHTAGQSQHEMGVDVMKGTEVVGHSPPRVIDTERCGAKRFLKPVGHLSLKEPHASSYVHNRNLIARTKYTAHLRLILSSLLILSDKGLQPNMLRCRLM